MPNKQIELYAKITYIPLVEPRHSSIQFYQNIFNITTIP